MLALVLVAVQAASVAPDAPPEVRTLTVAIVDEAGGAVEDLAPEDVAVLVNGAARPVTRVVRDERPLTVAVLVDTSEAVGSSFRLNVIDAVTAFLRRLPEGSRYCIWATGDRPSKVVELTSDPAAASRALKRVLVTGGNTMLDALVEAARDLRKQEGARTAVVAVTGIGIEFSSRERHQVVEQAKGGGTVFMAVQFEEGEGPAENRRDYEYVLSTLAKETGGLHEIDLSAMGVASSLQRIANDLRSHYRVTYEALPGATEPKLEVRVARPGVKVRVLPSLAVESAKR